jgi:hypothetical protein
VAACHPSPDVDWFGKSTLKVDDDRLDQHPP